MRFYPAIVVLTILTFTSQGMGLGDPPPGDPNPQVRIKATPRVFADDSDAKYPICFDITNTQQATIVSVQATLKIGGKQAAGCSSDNGREVVAGDAANGNASGGANGTGNIYTYLCQFPDEFGAVDLTKTGSNRTDDATITLRVKLRYTDLRNDVRTITRESDEVPLAAFLDKNIEVVHIGRPTSAAPDGKHTFNALGSRQSRAYREARPYMRLRSSGASVYGKWLPINSVYYRTPNFTTVFSKPRTRHVKSSWMIKPMAENPSPNYSLRVVEGDGNPLKQPGETWTTSLLNEQRGVVFVFHYGTKEVTDVMNGSHEVIDVRRRVAVSADIVAFPTAVASLACHGLTSPGDVSYTNIITGSLGLLGGVATLATLTNPVGWAATGPALAIVAGGTTLLDEAMVAADSADPQGARASVFGGLVQIDSEGNPIGSGEKWSTTALNGGIGGPDYPGGAQTTNNWNRPKALSMKVTQSQAASVHQTWSIFSSTSAIAWCAEGDGPVGAFVRVKHNKVDDVSLCTVTFPVAEPESDAGDELVSQ